MRASWFAGAAITLAGLTGCALPTAVTIASYAADGASFLSTGRSVTDHGISILLQKDCALFRAVRGKPVCKPMRRDDLVYDIAFADRRYTFRDPDDSDAGAALQEAGQYPVVQAPKPLLRAQPRVIVAQAFDRDPERSEVVKPVRQRSDWDGHIPTQRAVVPLPQGPSDVGVPIPKPPPAYRVVAGAFNQWVHAKARRLQVATQLSRLGHSDLGVQIARLPNGSPATYVVLTRPVATQDARYLVERLQLDKGELPWVLRSGRSSL